MSILSRTFLAAAFALTLSAARAQTTTSAPSTQKIVLPEGPLNIVITGVAGIVQTRPAEGQPFQRCTPGMTIAEGAELRTGPKSKVQFEIAPHQTVTLDRLGTVKIARATFENSKVLTDLGMGFGRLELEVKAAGIEHSSTIHSPSSTLAVRGTKVVLYDQPPFTPQAVSLTGRAEFRNAHRQIVAFGSNKKTTISSDKDSAAATALVSSVIDPSTGLARTPAELRQIVLLISQGGFVIGNVLVGNSSISDANLVNVLPGPLSFALRWGKPGDTFADLNLVVIAPDTTPQRPDFLANPPFIYSLDPSKNPLVKVTDAEGRTSQVKLSQAYPTHSPSGGELPKNHIGPQGLEIASWPAKFPQGIYFVGVFNLVDATNAGAIPKGSSQNVPFKIDVFQNGQQVGPTFAGKVNFGETLLQPYFIGDFSAAAKHKPAKSSR